MINAQKYLLKIHSAQEKQKLFFKFIFKKQCSKKSKIFLLINFYQFIHQYIYIYTVDLG